MMAGDITPGTVVLDDATQKVVGTMTPFDAYHLRVGRVPIDRQATLEFWLRRCGLSEVPSGGFRILISDEAFNRGMNKGYWGEDGNPSPGHFPELAGIPFRFACGESEG